MSNNKDKINEEVYRLLNLKRDDEMTLYKEFEKLRDKYNDDNLVNLIYDKYVEKYKKLMKRAMKIKNKIIEKYPNLEPREYETKIHQYQKHYDFDDDERKIILKLIRNEKKIKMHDKDIRQLLPFTPLSKALGYRPQEYAYMTGDMKVEGKEMEYVNKLVKSYHENLQLSQRVQLQTLVYTDVELCALNGVVNRYEVPDVYSFIDPLLFALFIPKFDSLEMRMLLTSIAKLINTRKEGGSFQTQPEVELFEDLCKDPSETQCTTEIEPFKDLYKRNEVQVALWKCVLSLRQGRYYTEDSAMLKQKLETCKNVIFDSPDFAFVRDVGHTLRKLFGCFSYRPIHVFTTPSNPIMSLGLSSSSNMASMEVGVETTIPMQTCRLMPEQMDEKINFNEVIKGKPTTFLKGKHLVVKQQTIISCDGVLVFYVPRRYQGIEKRKTYSLIPKELPVTTTSLERVNNTEIDYCETLQLERGQTYSIKSVVVIETLSHELFGDTDNEIIVGTSAMVRSENENCGYYYSPIDARCNPETLSTDNYDKISPVTAINENDFKEQYSKYGTLFIYNSNVKTKNILC